MATPNPLSTKNFNSRLNTFFKGEQARRDVLQSFIVFALHHYAGTGDSDKQTKGDTTHLTTIMNGCVGVKSLPSLTIKDYIKEFANVHWVVAKDKTMVFKKISKGEDPTVTIPEVVWYEWEGGKHNKVKPDFDIVWQAHAMLKRLETAIKEGRGIKDEAKAEEIKQALAGVLVS